MTHYAPSTILVGLGNPILTDDAVGWRVVDHVREMLVDEPARDSVAITEACVGGLSLAELLVGHSRAIIVDAIITQEHVPGTVLRLRLEDLPGTLNTASAHDTNLTTALRTLRRHGALVPLDSAIEVIAIEAQDVWTFGETCTAAVEACIPDAAAQVLTLLRGNM